MSINFENISLLVSGCLDLLANKKCAQVAWTYLDCHQYKFLKYFTLVSGCMDLLANRECAQVTWTYWTVIIINFENISLLVSGCMDLWQIKSVLSLYGPIRTAILCSGCMDLYDLDYKHFMSINFENISLLISGCMDLLANKKNSGYMDLFGLS